MIQPIQECHTVDDDGNPAGGTTEATGLSIEWQNGPLCVDGERREPNGCFVETVIAAAIGRLKHYQTSKFACESNTKALDALRTALQHLQYRTREREQRGVEGTHTV